MKTKRIVLILAVVMALLLAVGCSSTPAQPTPASQPAASDGLTGIVWQWLSVADRPSNSTAIVPNPENYTITFNSDGSLNGRADCNNFTGTYSQEGGFFITLGAVTMAACGENSLEQEYLQLLGSIVAGGPDGAGGLALETAGGEKRMEFQNGGAAQ